MKKTHTQILYYADAATQQITKELREEAKAMQKAGFLISAKPLPGALHILYRGPTMWQETDYPRHHALIQGWREYSNTLFMSKYYPYIKDMTIPTFFTTELNEATEREIRRRDWDGAFVKNDVSAIVQQGKARTVWPDSSFDEITAMFRRLPKTDMYAVRQRINVNSCKEERYWILNHQAYHRTGIIPDIVSKAVQRLRPIGSHYYVIDATPDFIVEINPGESSDRYIENNAAMFADWFKQSFL